MRLARVSVLALLLVASGCALSPFESDHPDSKSGGAGPAGTASGSGPVITSVPEVGASPPGAEPGVIAQPPPLPRERPKTAPATLSPASRSLVAQAQTQRNKGDLPGATVSLERALRIEPNNPLLWIELGRLRMDQQNYPQAESMGRKALSMSVGDHRHAVVGVVADLGLAEGSRPEPAGARRAGKIEGTLGALIHSIAEIIKFLLSTDNYGRNFAGCMKRNPTFCRFGLHEVFVVYSCCIFQISGGQRPSICRITRQVEVCAGWIGNLLR